MLGFRPCHTWRRTHLYTALHGWRHSKQETLCRCWLSRHTRLKHCMCESGRVSQAQCNIACYTYRQTSCRLANTFPRQNVLIVSGVTVQLILSLGRSQHQVHYLSEPALRQRKAWTNWHMLDTATMWTLCGVSPTKFMLNDSAFCSTNANLKLFFDMDMSNG
jgi:hypothetical protein